MAGGRVFPGDDARSDRRRDKRQVGPAARLKENVIIGKLIPAGTGMSRYRNVQVAISEDAIPEYWLQRQREHAEAMRDSDYGEMTREEAESLLGGASTPSEE